MRSIQFKMHLCRMFVREINKRSSKSFVVHREVSEQLVVMVHVELIDPHTVCMTHCFMHHQWEQLGLHGLHCLLLDLHVNLSQLLPVTSRLSSCNLI
jgi:hypothetical protein